MVAGAGRRLACHRRTLAEGRTRVLHAFPDPDIVVNNAGGPPPGTFATSIGTTGSAHCDGGLYPGTF